MAIPSFYHPDLGLSDTQVQLSANEAAHALKSRRLGVGQGIRLLNGRGLVAQAEISQVSQRDVTVSVLSVELSSTTQPSLTIASAVPKGDRQRVMVEMLTQLGIKELIPLACEHSVTRYKPNMHDKWQRWAIESCKQSQNPWLPEINEGVALSDLMRIAADRLVYTDIAGVPLAALGTEIANPIVLVGPEGGFSDGEVSLFKQHNIKSVRTAGHILRTEAAAISLASQWLAI